jgi:hypothetical protein
MPTRTTIETNGSSLGVSPVPSRYRFEPKDTDGPNPWSDSTSFRAWRRSIYVHLGDDLERIDPQNRQYISGEI